MHRPDGHRAVAINVIRLGNLVDDHWTLVLLWRESNPQDFVRSNIRHLTYLNWAGALSWVACEQTNFLLTIGLGNHLC